MLNRVLRPDRVTIGVEGDAIAIRHIPELIPWDAVPAVCKLMLEKAEEAKRNARGLPTQGLNLRRSGA